MGLENNEKCTMSNILKKKNLYNICQTRKINNKLKNLSANEFAGVPYALETRPMCRACPFCSPSIFIFVQLSENVSMFWFKYCTYCSIPCVPLYIVGSGRADSPWLCICRCCSRRLLASRTGFSNWVLRLMWLKIQCIITNNRKGIIQSLFSSQK